jgi:integrase
LRDIEPLTGRGRYVFPSPRSVQGPLSDNAITAALRRIGYTGEQMSWDGFRAMASTLLNELGFPPDIIELQLAHQERNEVRAAYNRAQRLDERRKMMQAWADYLDGLRPAGTSCLFAVWRDNNGNCGIYQLRRRYGRLNQCIGG